jgi:hypothetical protein
VSTESWAVAAVPAATAALLAVAPVDEVAFFLQFFGAGTLIAYRAAQRNPERDTFPIQVRWGCVGLCVALALGVADGLLW